jgi:hypothetical protein
MAASQECYRLIGTRCQGLKSNIIIKELRIQNLYNIHTTIVLTVLTWFKIYTD